jgi:hypothetical protein
MFRWPKHQIRNYKRYDSVKDLEHLKATLFYLCYQNSKCQINHQGLISGKQLKIPESFHKAPRAIRDISSLHKKRTHSSRMTVSSGSPHSTSLNTSLRGVYHLLEVWALWVQVYHTTAQPSEAGCLSLTHHYSSVDVQNAKRFNNPGRTVTP